MKNLSAINRIPLGLVLSRYPSVNETSKNLEYTYSRSMNVLIFRGDSNQAAEPSYLFAINQIKNHLSDPDRDCLQIYMGFSEFESPSYQYLLNMIECLNNFHKEKKDLKVYWSFKHERRMLDVGLVLLPFCEFPFKIVEK